MGKDRKKDDIYLAIHVFITAPAVATMIVIMLNSVPSFFFAYIISLFLFVTMTNMASDSDIKRIKFEKAFENEYHCTIINDDEFGLIGHIEFNEEKYEIAFLLRFGGNDKPRKWQAI